jgi:hypothetical protein
MNWPIIMDNGAGIMHQESGIKTYNTFYQDFLKIFFEKSYKEGLQGYN